MQVVSAYPITPQTSIVEKLADFVADGALPAQFIKVESEHSALQVCVSAAGARRAHVHRDLEPGPAAHARARCTGPRGMRAPIVMGVVNRAVAPPWDIGADHTDTIVPARHRWIQFYAESNQEVLDTVLQAYRLAEDPRSACR